MGIDYVKIPEMHKRLLDEKGYVCPLPDEYRDFRVFLNNCLYDRFRLKATPVQLSVAHFIQTTGIVPRLEGSGKNSDIIINAFRNLGKSTITTYYCIWLAAYNPLIKIAVVSATGKLSSRFVFNLKNSLDSIKFLSFMSPKRKSNDIRHVDRADEFDVATCFVTEPTPTFSSYSITGSATGSRADIIIFDDCEVHENSKFVKEREAIWEGVLSIGNLIRTNNEYGRRVFLGTPHHIQSMYHRLVNESAGIKDFSPEFRIWPAQFVADKSDDYEYTSKIAPDLMKVVKERPELIDRPTSPSQMSETAIRLKKAEIGESKYRMQYMLDVRMNDISKYVLKLKDLIVMDVDSRYAPSRISWSNRIEYKEANDIQTAGIAKDQFYLCDNTSEDLMEYQGCVMAIDPSGKGEDETGYVVSKFLNGNIFILESGGFGSSASNIPNEGGYSEETLKKLAYVAKKHGVDEIITEANFGGGQYAELLKAQLRGVHECKVENVFTGGQLKVMRICDTLEPVICSHRLIFDRSVVMNDFASIKQYPENIRDQFSLFYQMTHICREKDCLLHEDRLEPLKMVVEYWTKSLSLDQEEEGKKEKRRKMNQKYAIDVAIPGKRTFLAKDGERMEIDGYDEVYSRFEDNTNKMRDYF